MEEKLKTLFLKAKYEGTQDLNQQVWQNIVLVNKRRATIELWLFAFIGLVSLVSLVPVIEMLRNNFVQSGFYDYFSLAFSSGMFITNWKEFIFSLSESLPVVSIIYSLVLMFIFFLSIKYSTKQIIRSRLAL